MPTICCLTACFLTPNNVVVPARSRHICQDLNGVGGVAFVLGSEGFHPDGVLGVGIRRWEEVIVGWSPP